MNSARIQQILDAFTDKRVVVVGDVMLDEYIWGQAKRISPEAPVMVVDADRYSSVPGGAANVVNNLCALGAKVSIVGIVGDDDAAKTLTDALGAEGAETSGLVTTPDRPTTRKTRIIAHSQQVVRVDHEKRGSLPAATAAQLVKQIASLAVGAHAIVISDYQKGVVGSEVITACAKAAAKAGIPLTGNLKPKAIAGPCPLTVITLNLLEASQALSGDPLDSEEKVLAGGRDLVETTGADYILITRGAHGLTLFSRAHPDKPEHVPARSVAVYDVAGAGDTVISTLTLALAVGATPLEAITLATHAAGEAVKKVGVSTVSAAEIIASFS